MRTVSRNNDIPTLLAIAVVVYLSAALLHELGHASSCVLLGGGFEGISTSWCRCDKLSLSAWSIRAENAAGTGVNLVIGSLALLALLQIKSTGATRYALWLLAATHLFLGAGYLIFDPIFGFGDWTTFLDGLQGAPVVRVVLIIAGISVAGSAMYLLVPYLGVEGRVRRSRELALLPWAVVGCGLMTLVALPNVGGMKFAITSFFATGAGTSMLAWMYHMRSDRGVAEPLSIPKSTGWRVAGVAALVLAIVAGRGFLL